MKPQVVLSLFLGLQSAVACFVPTFDVDSSSAGGTKAQGGNASGGKATVGAGGTHAVNGGSQTGGTSGGTETGGTSGGTETGGTSGAEAGAATVGGDAGAGGDGASASAGPYRVGFSVFHDSASGDSHANSKLPDATFTKPPGTQPGDFMLVFFGDDHSLMNMSDTALADEGWILWDQHEELGGDGQGTYIAYRFADGSEPDPIVFKDINPDGAGNGVQGLLSVYRGVNAKAPINAYEVAKVDTNSDTKHVETPTPAITTTADNCRLIAGLSPDTAIDAPVISIWPAGFDENQVSVKNPPTPYPFGWANIYSAERQQAKAGSVAASVFGWDLTYGGTQSYGSLAFVLALAP